MHESHEYNFKTKYSLKNRRRKVSDRLKRETQRHKVVRFLLFLKPPPKNLVSGGKIRDGRVTGNKQFFCFGLIVDCEIVLQNKDCDIQLQHKDCAG